MPRWLTDCEQRLWRSWLAANAALLDAIDADLNRHGLSHADYEILAHLSESPNDALRMSELAARVLLTKSGLTYRVTQLEEHGLVERRSCPSDARGVEAALTRAGRRLIERAAPGHVETVRGALIDHLRPATIRALAADLGALLAEQGIEPHGDGHADALPSAGTAHRSRGR